MLKAIDGPLAGKEFVFSAQATIGRVEDNDIVVLEAGVSRHHARVYEHFGVYMVEDKGSANGTCLNGERIDGVEVLREGDHITLSQNTFQFSQFAGRQGEATREVKLRTGELDELDVSRTSSIAPLAYLGTRRGKKVAAAGALLLAAAFALLYAFGRDGERVEDLSATAIRYGEKDFAGNVLGYGEYDKSHRRQVRVQFDYLGGRVALQLGAWGIGTADEVQLRVNGRAAGYLPVTMDRWVYGVRIELPRTSLIKGKPNEVVFHNTKHDDPNNRWEIYDLHIEQEVIPTPNEQEAERLYLLGKEAWRDRHVDPGNFSRAFSALKESRNLLEGLDVKPELYEIVLTFIGEVDREMKRLYDDGLFTARRLQRVDNNLREAHDVLERTMRYFRQDDYRYRELKRYLDALKEQARDDV